MNAREWIETKRLLDKEWQNCVNSSGRTIDKYSSTYGEWVENQLIRAAAENAALREALARLTKAVKGFANHPEMADTVYHFEASLRDKYWIVCEENDKAEYVAAGAPEQEERS